MDALIRWGAEVLLIERGQYELAAQVGEPTKHMGHAAAALERKGEQTQVGDLNRAIKEGNARHAERADLATSVLDRLTDQQSFYEETPQRRPAGQSCPPR